MIATVKVAPFERWCEALRNAPWLGQSAASVAGMMIQIDTASMRTPALSVECGGMEWRVVNHQEIRERSGATGDPPVCWVCEHQLEMD